MGFAGASGWIVAVSNTGFGPFISDTTNGGSTWTGFREHNPSMGGTSAVTVAGTSVALVPLGGGVATIDSIDTAGTKALSRLPQTLRATAATSIGSQILVAGATAETSEGPYNHAAIYATDANQAWSEQPIALTSSAELRGIDARSTKSGIAGGMIVQDTIQPLCLFLRDGRWEPGSLPSALDGRVVSSVIQTSTDDAWAVANVLGAPGVTFLHTVDSGATWSSVSTPFDTTMHVRALTRRSLVVSP